MIQAVIFDMDGLMFDTERLWGTFWAPAMRRMGRTPDPQFIDDVRGTAGERMYQVMRRYYGQDFDCRALHLAYYDIAREVFREFVPEKPGLRELLDYLKARGIPMAVASSSPRDMVEHNLTLTGVAGYFGAVVCGDQVERSKPDPDIFYKAAEAIGAKPETTLVLEDSYNGVRAGAAGGFVTVMVPDLLAENDEMRALAREICESLSAVRQRLENNAW